MKVLLLAFAALLMPAARITTAATPPPSTKISPKPAPRSDAEIERSFRERLSKSKVARNGFQIRVQGGIATLTGRTDVVQHKGVATRMAKSAGARAVNNRIEISDAGRQRAAASLEKGRRAAQVQRPLGTPVPH